MLGVDHRLHRSRQADCERYNQIREEISKMEELELTRLWMAGVVTLMAVFGIIAGIGYMRFRKQDNGADSEE